MTLADLVAAAARGDGPLPLDSAARLYGVVAADLDAGNYGSAGPDVGCFPVTIETISNDGLATVDVYGLRYLVDLEIGGGSEAVSALCTVPGCPEPAMARKYLARVCTEHISHVDKMALFYLNMPLAGDARGPNWEEDARRDIRVLRLNVWQEDLDDRAKELEIERGRLNIIRRGH